MNVEIIFVSHLVTRSCCFAYLSTLQRYLEQLKSTADEKKMLTILRQLRYLEDSCAEEIQDRDVESVLLDYINA